MVSQGSSCLATLGFGTESRWDSCPSQVNASPRAVGGLAADEKQMLLADQRRSWAERQHQHLFQFQQQVGQVISCLRFASLAKTALVTLCSASSVSQPAAGQKVNRWLLGKSAVRSSVQPGSLAAMSAVVGGEGHF